MIRKRTTEETERQEIIQPKEINSSLRKEFKNWQEEAIYVIKVLKEQGVDIYDSERYGGMYLNKKNKMPSVFGRTSSKKEETNQTVNNINKDSLNNFFKK